MSKKDLKLIVLLGFLAGVVIQPLLINNGFLNKIGDAVGVSAAIAGIVAVVAFTVLAPVALWVASFLSRYVKILFQIGKFAAVGSLNSFLDLGLFNFLGILFGIPLGGTFVYGVFKSISFLAATTNSYIWNKAWTFGDASKSEVGKVATFYIVTAINWAINVGVATGVSSIQPENTLWITVIAPICGIFAGMAGNFLGYKFIVFKNAPKDTV